MDRIADIVAGITAVAMVTTIVAHRQSAQVINAVGNAYSGALRAAIGTAPRTG